MSEPIYVTIPCFFAMQVEVSEDDKMAAAGAAELIDYAMEAAYEYWSAINFPDSVVFTDASGAELGVYFDDSGSDCGPLYKIVRGNIGYVSPLEAQVDR